jgi:hypothetical protein
MSCFAAGRIGRTRPITRWLAPLAFMAFFLGSPAAFAQAVSPDEVVNATGAATPQVALTQAQKSAIYNVVMAHHIRSSATTPGAVPESVGAAVSPTAVLAELPDQAAAEASVDDMFAMDLKYAMVDGDIVMVDPVRMRVIEVIHRNAGP